MEAKRALFILASTLLKFHSIQIASVLLIKVLPTSCQTTGEITTEGFMMLLLLYSIPNNILIVVLFHF